MAIGWGKLADALHKQAMIDGYDLRGVGDGLLRTISDIDSGHDTQTGIHPASHQLASPPPSRSSRGEQGLCS